MTKQDINHFSVWFEKLNKDLIFKQAKSVVMPLTDDLFNALLTEGKLNLDEEIALNKEIAQLFQSVAGDKLQDLKYPLFIKGAFTSNKFNFWNCIIMGEHQWATKIKSLLESSIMNGAPLCKDIIVRELIPVNTHLHIYNGMPLTFEYRAFVDLKTKTVENVIPYWDFDTLSKPAGMEDMMVIHHFFNYHQKEYHSHLEPIQQKVQAYLDQNGFGNLNELHDKWSVDIMLDYANQAWLIDMAKAEDSWGYQ